MMKLLPLVFAAIPLGILFNFYQKYFEGKTLGDLDAQAYLMLSLGILLAALAVFLYKYFSKAIVFDKGQNYYWRGKRELDGMTGAHEIKGAVPLAEIHALQILSELVSSSSKGASRYYHSYELNIVKKDGTRVNVVDHGNKRTLLEDTQMIAQFLGVPVWDRI